MSRQKLGATQKFYKSGTPITTKPDPRARIIKGSTTRRPPVETSRPPPPPTFDIDTITGPCPCNFGKVHPPGFDINRERMKAKVSAEAAYGRAMTEDPNDTDKIEEYLASQHQKVLVVKRMDVVGPNFNALSYQQPTQPEYPRVLTREEIMRTIPHPTQEEIEEWAEEDKQRDFQRRAKQEPTLDQVQDATPEFPKQNLELGEAEFLSQGEEIQQQQLLSQDQHYEDEHPPTDMPSEIPTSIPPKQEDESS